MLDLSKIYESLLFWRGDLNASRFAISVGQSRQHVQTTIISPFLESYPNDVLVSKDRRFGRTLNRYPITAPRDIWSFFSLLITERNYRRIERGGVSSLADINVTEVVPPDSSGSLVLVSRAAAQKSVLHANYLFKNRGVRAVRFSPHVMVRTPRRVHFRGHLLIRIQNAFEDLGYRDLVPGRFLEDGKQALVSKGFCGVEGDSDWNKKVRLVFRLNPELPRDAFFALQQEFGLETNIEGHCQLTFSTRKALEYSYKHHVFDRTIGPERLKVWIPYS